MVPQSRSLHGGYLASHGRSGVPVHPNSVAALGVLHQQHQSTSRGLGGGLLAQPCVNLTGEQYGPNTRSTASHGARRTAGIRARSPPPLQQRHTSSTLASSAVASARVIEHASPKSHSRHVHGDLPASLQARHVRDGGRPAKVETTAKEAEAAKTLEAVGNAVRAAQGALDASRLDPRGLRRFAAAMQVQAARAAGNGFGVHIGCGNESIDLNATVSTTMSCGSLGATMSSGSGVTTASTVGTPVASVSSASGDATLSCSSPVASIASVSIADVASPFTGAVARATGGGSVSSAVGGSGCDRTINSTYRNTGPSLGPASPGGSGSRWGYAADSHSTGRGGAGVAGCHRRAVSEDVGDSLSRTWAPASHHRGRQVQRSPPAAYGSHRQSPPRNAAQSPVSGTGNAVARTTSLAMARKGHKETVHAEERAVRFNHCLSEKLDGLRGRSGVDEIP
eukprot:TRINITY_DN10450_c1_g1_i1.p1 TRINITY_DN10450_c1_g1~~TRINITY_DN10450_c1_g1_i1.p1  ORF type:complete len:452 (-),score=45.04 TRINITY_DN10450_c1_g1_i1:171-1526(-)